MDQSKCEDFTQEITNRIKASTMDKESPVIDEKTLNKKWYNLNFTIKLAATKHIPFIYKQTRNSIPSVGTMQHDDGGRTGPILTQVPGTDNGTKTS
ncbi:35480_t:CDS:2 [Gigaspora margarita]|uniref:35480_t:CDS:1 n=1 Tax=Gigaspora margarita TaxID=4874 RepID=A0ABN7VFR8_GIGMA|nr:35480_t:CDS:2 [Gigaspora margarita]